MEKWVCVICGYVYDETAGDPDSGIAPGTKFEDIPADWVCPLCGLCRNNSPSAFHGFSDDVRHHHPCAYRRGVRGADEVLRLRCLYDSVGHLRL